MVASSGIDLLQRTDDPARRQKLSDGVRQAVDRGAALTRQLLAFSRRAPLRSEVLDLGRQIEGIRFLLERSLREDIEITLNVRPDLGRVELDAGELELALLNLAVNARDAMPKGGLLTISAFNQRGPEGGDMVCVEVADTGAGISEDALGRIFEPFFTTKEVGRGTGLGLSQVYGFMRSSGGDVTVRSVPGEGTTFTLCFPQTDKPLSEPVVAASAPERPGRKGGRILLVEDDDAVAAGVGHMLRDLGYTYVRVAIASEAVASIQSGERFDAMLSDMVMPGEMDGLGLASFVREHRPELPVVLMTGYSEAASTAANDNFTILLKPYRLEDLRKALAAAI
jgi:CheY-like chemotaxis protein